MMLMILMHVRPDYKVISRVLYIEDSINLHIHNNSENNFSHVWHVVKM